MKKRTKPCISFVLALIFLISSIPIPAIESQASGTDVESVISGNIIDETEAVSLLSQTGEPVSGNNGDNLPENPDETEETKCTINVTGTNINKATISVFSGGNRVEPVNSQYSVEMGKEVTIVAEPDDFYQVASDSANQMKLTDKEKGIYEWKIESFNSDSKRDYEINIEEIEDVEIIFDGISMKIGRQMRGGKVTAVSENGMEDCVKIVPDSGYCINFFGEPLTPLNGNLYRVNENTYSTVIFKEDNTVPEISISNNRINGKWYIKGKDDLYVKIIDDAKEEDIKVNIIPDIEKIPLGEYLYKFTFRSTDFGPDRYERTFTITAEDEAGNEGSESITVVYDDKAPEVCSVSINSANAPFVQNNKPYFCSDKIKMDVNVEENIGLSHLNYVICQDKHNESWSEEDFYENRTIQQINLPDENCLEGMKTVDIPIEDLESGTYYVYFAATDLAGNRQIGILPFTEFHIDRTPPTIDIGESNKWYKKSDTIHITADISDECTADGLIYQYRIVKLSGKDLNNKEDYKNAEILKPEGEWKLLGVSGKGATSYETSISVNEINENGSYALLIWAKDGCGNKSDPESYVFHYDKEPPKIDEFAFEVTEGNETIVDKFKKPFGNFFRLNTVEGKKQEVSIKVRAYDNKIYLENYCKDMKLEINDIYAYYIEHDKKVQAREYKNNEASQNKLPEFGFKTKLFRESANSDIYKAALNVPKEAVFYEIMIVVRDKAGNIHCAFPEDFGEYSSSSVMVDKKEPDIDVNINREFAEPDYKELTGNGIKKWYNSNRLVSYTITAQDLESGLSDLKVMINNNTISENNLAKNNPAGMKKSYATRIDLRKDLIGADGKYALYAISHDNAGNIGKLKEGIQTIYIDEDAPIITNITFSSGESDNMKKSPSQYGFFFKKETMVKVTATDFVGNTKNPGSGVKSFTYYMQSPAGKKSKEVTVPAEIGGNNTYTASFEIPAGFKGQVYVKAMDNTKQESDYANPKGVIIESSAEHKLHSYASIKLKDTPYKDANGNPLYNKKPVIRFETKDTKSGIAKNVWNVKAANDKKPEKNEKLIVQTKYDKENGKFRSALEGDTEWEISDKLDLNLVKEASKNYQVVSEKNSIEASLELTDNVGNTRKAPNKIFSVDTTAPKVFVEYDNNEAYNGKFYKEERYATIHVIDANFSAENCEIKTTGPGVNKSEWEHIPGSGCNGKIHSKDCEYICQVGFVTDGDYTFGFECTDLAGWSGSYGQIDEFTIDMTEPVIQVSYDNQNAQNGNFYKEARIATIQIEEHNFEPEDVTVTITATNEGSAIAVPSVVGWTQNDDMHTATIAYDYDGEFTFDIEYTDLADNQAQEYEQDQFIIDITEPEIEITGIVDKSANKGTVQPVITCNDTNLEDAVISLKGVNRGTIKADYEIRRAGNGIVYKMKDLEHVKKNDDIYTLHVTARDKAGNEYEDEIHYSVNRFGSVYQYDKQTEALVNNYYSSQCDDLIVKEINVNTLKAKRVTYSKDGEIVTLQEGKDYRLSQSGDEFDWKEYVYTIFKENFEEDGKYILTLYSEDQADNHSDNRVKGKNIEFVMDRTAPSLVLSGIKDGGQYNENTKELVINAEDNIGLAGVEVYNDGIQIADFDGETITEANGTLSISLQSKNDWQELTVITRDMAGNENRSETLTYLITTNLLVQWYKNPWLFYGSMVIILLLAGMTEYFVRRRKGQKKKRMVG